MRILLDECVPWPVRHCLVGHQCTTAQQQGWGGWKNGDLIRRAEAKFDLFITSDQNMQYQQNLAGRQIAILELSTNDLRRLQSAADLLRTTVDALAAGEFRHLEVP